MFYQRSIESNGKIPEWIYRVYKRSIADMNYLKRI